jgi:hypothetical protein
MATKTFLRLPQSVGLGAEQELYRKAAVWVVPFNVHISFVIWP